MTTATLKRTIRRQLIPALLWLLVVSCSASGPVLLPGDRDAPAGDAVYDFTANDLTTPDEISIDAQGNAFDRTNISIAFRQDATVGEVNDLLRSLEGSIVSMRPDVSILLVKIPDPNTLEALDAIVLDLEASPVVRRVTRAAMSGRDELPGNFDATTDTLNEIDHHLAVSASAAWNAKAAIVEAPLLIIPDFFGGGVPGAKFNVKVLDPTDFDTALSDFHGYHVLGIATGMHTRDASKAAPTDLVTGMYPATVDLRVVDTMVNNSPAWEDKIMRIITAAPAKVVVSTSLNGHCIRSVDGSTELPCIKRQTARWLEKQRGTIRYHLGERQPLVEDKFLHLTSAGNLRPAPEPDNRIAELNSQFAAASQMTGLRTFLGVSVPNTNNALVIENRRNSTHLVGISPGCEAASSKLGGDLSGIGQFVWSFGSATGTAGNLSGTSMATPQVAGLATYVWALNPSLSPQAVKEILIATSARPENCNSVLGAPLIDAYAAVLAAKDDAGALVAGNATAALLAPVRNAILDPVDDEGTDGGDGAFTESDLERFTMELKNPIPEEDYSRFDLNGDGFTGGSGTRRFNLDMDAEHTYGVVTRQGKEYNESAVSDMDVLCFYAHSPIYAGDVERRDELLKDSCANETLLFLRQNDTTFLSGVHSMTTNGVEQTPLAVDPNIRDTDPELSPDGSRVVFARDFGTPFSVNSHRQIVVMDIDGTNLTRFTTTTEGGDFRPSWSPDGTKIAFVSNRDGLNSDIYLLNADGTGLQQVTDTSLRSYHKPRWSPSGDELLFASGPRASFQGWKLRALNMGTLNVREVLDYSNARPGAYEWSPDGTHIVFEVDFRLRIVDAAGGNMVQVCTSVEANQCSGPQWSPDGSKIAFSARTTFDGVPSKFDIFTMNPDGTGLANHTLASSQDFDDDQPQWSKDGEQLFFVSVRDGYQKIFRTGVDDGVTVDLSRTTAGTDDFFPTGKF